MISRRCTYRESVEVRKDIALLGDGPVHEIVVEGSDVDGFAISLLEGDAVVSGLTLRGASARLMAVGGAPTIEQMVFDGVGSSIGSSNGSDSLRDSSIQVIDGSTATVRGNELQGGGHISVATAAAPAVEGNILVGGPGILILDSGTGTKVHGNHIRDAQIDGVAVWGTAPITVTGNTVSGFNGFGIYIEAPSSTVSDNEVTGDGEMGIRIAPRSTSSTVAGNDVSGARFGIGVEATDATVINNNVAETEFAIAWKTGDGRLKANDVRNNYLGIVITGGSPVVEHNTSCDNVSVNFDVVEPATPDVRNNGFCPEPVHSP